MSSENFAGHFLACPSTESLSTESFWYGLATAFTMLPYYAFEVSSRAKLDFWLAFFKFFQIEEIEIGRCLWRPPGAGQPQTDLHSLSLGMCPILDCRHYHKTRIGVRAFGG